MGKGIESVVEASDQVPMAEEVGLESLFSGLDFQACGRVFEAQEKRACVFEILVRFSFNSLQQSVQLRAAERTAAVLVRS